MTRFLVLAFAAMLAAESPEAERWWSHVVFLADDKLEGRDTGSEGHRTAARYVAQQFERAGLKPAGTKAYLQPIAFRSDRIDETRSRIEVFRDGAWRQLVLGEDAYFTGRSATNVETELVFAGYGFAVPDKGFDEFRGLDVKGKIVVYATGTPLDTGIEPNLLSHFQSSGERAKLLRENGALGIISVRTPGTADIPWDRSARSRLMPAMRLAALDAKPLIGIAWNPARASMLFEEAPHTFAEIQDLARNRRALPKFPLKTKLRVRSKVNSEKLVSPNVAGLLSGEESRNEFVVVSAHLDHVGLGNQRTGDRIYNGALDNAAGVATIIEAAGALKSRKLKRSVVFVALTAEEKGLLGSQYFANNPTVPAAGIVANINVDMFMPLFPLKHMTILGSQESTLGDLAITVAQSMGIGTPSDPNPERNGFIRSDQYSFIRRGIPSLAFKIGYLPGSAESGLFRRWLADYYHSPKDDISQPVDKDAAVLFNRYIVALVEAAANADERPAWKPASFFRRFGQ